VGEPRRPRQRPTRWRLASHADSRRIRLCACAVEPG
jgi:hypothetical protein